MGVGFHGGSSSGWGGNDDSGSEAAGSAEHVLLRFRTQLQSDSKVRSLVKGF